MPALKQRFSPLSRRLMPLYISSFLQGAVLWYAIEKLFMTEIGFSIVGIGVMVAVMSIVMLIIETPSGILADRWSRKGVIILGSTALLISAIIGGFSYTEVTFIISTIFWGIFSALYSGTYDSVIYDTVMEEHGSSKKFAQTLGKLRAVEGASFVTGALISGVVASTLGLRETFFLSIPLILLSIFFLLKLREPTLHKAEVSEPVLTHIKQTFAAVLKKKALVPIVVSLVGFALIQETLFELSQLWFIALAAPLALYGVFSAAVFSTWTVGGLIVGSIQSRRRMIVVGAVLLAAIATLAVSPFYWLTLTAQFTMGVILIAYGVILTQQLHDELPSRLRAGASSVVSTLSRTLLIPGSIIITVIAQENSIFDATWGIFAIAIISIVALLFTHQHKQVKSA